MRYSRVTILVLLLSLCATQLAYADGPAAAPASNMQAAIKPPQTKLEGFLGTKGVLYIRDMKDFGDVSWVYVEAVAAYLPGRESDKTLGLNVTASNRGALSTPDARTCYLDYDEAKSLSQAISYMQSVAGDWKGQPGYREADFLTNGGLTLTIYHDGKHEAALLECTDGYSLSNDLAYPGDLEQFKDNIDHAIAWLSQQ